MIKISLIKQTIYNDLINKYENKLELPCTMKVGMIYYIDELIKPKDFCDSAWNTLLPFIKSIIDGTEIYEGWMKNKSSAIVSCNDGFRPMSFLIELV